VKCSPWKTKEGRALILGLSSERRKSFPALKATRARIQAGMELSPMTPKKMKEAYRVAERAGLV